MVATRMSPNSSGGRVTTPTAAEISPPPSVSIAANGSRDGRHLVVSAIAIPPLGRRRLWLLLVQSCSWCSCSHVHRAGSPTGGLRYAGCGGGQYYVQVVRAQGRVAA